MTLTDAELDNVTGGGIISLERQAYLESVHSSNIKGQKLESYENQWGTLSAKAVEKLVGPGPYPFKKR